MTTNIGIYGDQQKMLVSKQTADANPDLVLCKWCGGTGNELYSMYRQCPKCGGRGTLPKGSAE